MTIPEQTPPPPYARDAQPQPGTVRLNQKLTRPVVVYSILGITVVVYLLQMLTKAGYFVEPFMALGQKIMDPALLDALIKSYGATDMPLILGAKFSPLILDGQLWRLLTPVLLHGSPAHLLFNMYALFAIGTFLVAHYGHSRFIVLYLLSAVGGNLLSFWMTPGLSVGASTAVFGLVAAQGIFIYQNRSLIGTRARSMLNNTLFIIFVNLAFGFAARGAIDNWGHLGGLITGAAFAWFAGPLLTVHRPLLYEAELVDQRSPVTIWLTAAVVAFVLAAVTLIRFLLA
jgi:rhomboid protease GluP